MWNWGHLRWALKCQLIQITLENVITYYCCVTMWVFFFWHFEFRSVVSHLNCVGTRWPNWPLWPVCLVKQDLQTVSALPPWGPMIQLLQLCTSLWVSGRHWFWSNVHFLMIKKKCIKILYLLCVCVCLYRWLSADGRLLRSPRWHLSQLLSLVARLRFLWRCTDWQREEAVAWPCQIRSVRYATIFQTWVTAETAPAVARWPRCFTACTPASINDG